MEIEKSDVVYTLFPALTEGSYLPTATLGVNAQSPKIDLAVDFLQHVLSDDSQSLSYAMVNHDLGLPITESGYELQKQYADLILSEVATYTEQTFDLNEFVKSLKTPIFIDDTLKGIVNDSAYQYVKGEINLNTAIANIETAANNYITEKN